MEGKDQSLKSLYGRPIKGTTADYECPVCIELIVKPVVTPCQHLLCKECAIKILEKDPVCPFCRAQLTAFTPRVDQLVQMNIQKTFPKEYAQREKSLIQQMMKKPQKIKKELIYGNTHDMVDDPANKTNIHSWKVFLKLNDEEEAEKYIKKVTIDLHPTFKPSHFEFAKEPYEVQRFGWGTFVVPIKVFFQDWLRMVPAEFQHELSFKGDGVVKSFEFEFDKELQK